LTQDSGREGPTILEPWAHPLRDRVPEFWVESFSKILDLHGVGVIECQKNLVATKK
jgi:hypothetical protein